jgi:hypothetical protein
VTTATVAGLVGAHEGTVRRLRSDLAAWGMVTIERQTAPGRGETHPIVVVHREPESSTAPVAQTCATGEPGAQLCADRSRNSARPITKEEQSSKEQRDVTGTQAGDNRAVRFIPGSGPIGMTAAEYEAAAAARGVRIVEDGPGQDLGAPRPPEEP